MRAEHAQARHEREALPAGAAGPDAVHPPATSARLDSGPALGEGHAMTTRDDHWEQVYEQKGSGGVSWYRPHLEQSLALIEASGAPLTARIVDIGGGASTFVDDLLDRGFTDITIVDLSQAALDIAQARLGARASLVKWVQGDVTTLDLGCAAFDIWHDRAVFHFLVAHEQRAAYIARACCSLRTQGHVVLATFAPDGPEKCSGLPVVRYTVGELQHQFGPAFELVAEASDRHETPWGSTQSFVYCLCNKALAC